MKKLLIVGLMLICVNIPVVKANVSNNLVNLIPLEIGSAKSIVLMEVETKEVLYELNAHKKRAPASMTKIMTMKLVLDAMKNNEFTMDDILTTSNYASSMGGSQIYLAPNEQMKVEDLFKSMVIASANDAAVVLAERVSGSEELFANKMNHIAKTLGCKNTNFINATGLPTDNHYTTSYDMALIACDLLKEYKDIVIPYSSMYESYIRTDTNNPFWLVNTNKMLKLNNGVDGLKTGWTSEAGYCITTTMEKNGMRLVCVVMGAETPTLRNSDAMKVLNYGFNSYELVTLKEKNEIIETESDVLVNPSKYNIVTSNKMCYLKNKGESFNEVTYEITLYRDKIRNQEYENIGLIKAYIDGKLVDEVSLDLEEELRKSSYLEILYKVFISLF
ncbi:MAG: D-alanyl-D-alanine carboxypeptidase [Bacilli bacterium]|nr:D-alanyl-D-alanine carboxypeptidase [Bacilli bacterium]